MKIEVRYHSRSGNTKKLADAIAKAVGVEAKEVSCPLSENTDLLFLGSALYAGDIDQNVKEFIAANHEKIGRICNFSSAAAKKSTYKKVNKTASEYGVEMLEDEFFCNGSFLFLHKNRPNEDDLKNAAAFAKKAVSEFNR